MDGSGLSAAQRDALQSDYYRLIGDKLAKELLAPLEKRLKAIEEKLDTLTAKKTK